MGDFVGPCAIWSIYLTKAWLETGSLEGLEQVHTNAVVKTK